MNCKNMDTSYEIINYLTKDELDMDLSCMDKKERYKIWKRLPKCELHCHLDVCFSVDFFLNVIRKYNIQPNMSDEEIIDYYLFSKPGKSLDEFVEKALRLTDIYIDYTVVEDLAKHAVFNKYKEGVVLMEFRYSPSFMSFKHNLDKDLIHEAIVKGLNEAVALLEYKIQVGLLCTGDGGLSHERMKEAAEFCIKHKKDFVGYDHAGHEVDLKPFKDIFDNIREEGIPLSVHAGEDVTIPNLNSLYTAINLLHVKRIGHGIRVSESQELIDLVKEKDILLEVCPISNVLLNNVKSMDTHPIRMLYDAGVKVSVNSDDPGMFLTNITDNYEELYAHLNFTLADFMKMNLWAVQKSFVDPDIKNKIISKYF
ncbi:adenosine deaminase [Plasmodium reichenowi]|uniref:Adenosine deaminase n=1 Tax=Plasmodium reichenowi TaxID=5854 RepID=A0A2P9DFR4_PLARE|nr:adenosine deaminase [Plasmodium reichenowi]